MSEDNTADAPEMQEESAPAAPKKRRAKKKDDEVPTDVCLEAWYKLLKKTARCLRKPVPQVKLYGDANNFEKIDAIVDALVGLINEGQFLTQHGTKIAIITGDDNKPLLYCDPKQLALKFAEAQVPLGKTMLCADSTWIHDARHRKHDQVIFDPNGARTKRLGAYNLWKGFGVVPSEDGSWDLMQRHIQDHVCGGDEAHFDYVMNWMAFSVQRLDELPGVAIVMKGGKGVGKNTVVDALGRCFGPHYFVADSMGAVLGRFSGHLHNKLLVFMNEALWAGDKTAEGRLKSLVTDGFRAIEDKFVTIMHDQNLTRLMIASNEDWVVPASMDERRFAVFEVKVPWETGGPEHREFFGALHAELAAGGHARMLHDLLARDISEYDPREVPKTEALMEQKLASLNRLQAWWLDVLHAGRLPGASEEKPWGSTRLAILHQDYGRHEFRLPQEPEAVHDRAPEAAACGVGTR